MKTITMKDIANKLGVSTVTVSKALSDKDGVSETLREHIKETASMLGYHYSKSGQNTKDPNEYTISVLVADRYVKDNAFYLRVYQALVKKLLKKNAYGVMDIISAEEERYLNKPNKYDMQKVNAIIVLGQMSKDYMNYLAQYHLPLLCLDWYDEELELDAIVNDNMYGSALLTNYLIKQGHRKIGFIGNIYSTSSIIERYLGYYKAMIQHHLPVKEEWLIPDRNEEGRFIDMKIPNELPSAFVCNCDEVAYLYVNKLKREGIKVPEEVSIVGFDNHIFATLCEPQLTTVEVDIDMMVDTAAEAIIRKIQDANYHFGRRVISGNMIIRNSVVKG